LYDNVFINTLHYLVCQAVNGSKFEPSYSLFEETFFWWGVKGLNV